MKTTLEVANRKEGELIRAGLLHPEVRAFVKLMGALGALPSDRARMRVLNYVDDQMREIRANASK